MRYRVGVDTGGTHTDFVMVDNESGETRVHKVPSTPLEPTAAVHTGLQELLADGAVRASDVDAFVYGTTVVVNAIIQSKDKYPTALITTKGFRDVLELGRSHRQGDIYDVQWEPEPPLIPRALRFEVEERLDFRGEVVVALDDNGVREIARLLEQKGIRAVAVCLLHAYVNPEHERRVRTLLNEELPQLVVSISSEVSPIIAEYERSSTTAVDAFVKVPLSAHFRELGEKLRADGVEGSLLTMQANGGMISFSAAQERPIRVMNSGPVAGAIAGQYFANASRELNAITFDVGGTSSDIAVVVNGSLMTVPSDKIRGYPVQLSAVEVNPIGAGGGSIAWIDDGGALRVGPQSAGADPGPICYGKGGSEPTVTDAAVALGFLEPDGFLGGRMTLDRLSAVEAIRQRIAVPLAMTVEEAALGILTLAAHASLRAVRKVTIARGHDPRDFALVAFGGAGGLLASLLARELGVRRIVIPPNPGNCSATGLLLTDERHDYAVTRIGILGGEDPADMELVFTQLEEQGLATFEAEGIAIDRREMRRFLELRYYGQSFELTVECDTLANSQSIASVIEAFHSAHEKRYGHAARTDPVQVVTYKVSAIGKVERPRFDVRVRGSDETGPKAVRTMSAHFGSTHMVNVYQREDLALHDRIDGPAIVVESGSTTVLWPDQFLTVGPLGSLLVETR